MATLRLCGGSLPCLKLRSTSRPTHLSSKPQRLRELPLPMDTHWWLPWLGATPRIRPRPGLSCGLTLGSQVWLHVPLSILTCAPEADLLSSLHASGPSGSDLCDGGSGFRQFSLCHWCGTDDQHRAVFRLGRPTSSGTADDSVQEGISSPRRHYSITADRGGLEVSAEGHRQGLKRKQKICVTPPKGNLPGLESSQ